MQYNLKAVTLICFTSTLWLMSANTRSAENLTLERALDEVLKANTSLAVIQSKANALAQLPQQVSSLPDPALSINAMNLPMDSFSFDQEAMTQIQLGLFQALPYPGKLALRRQAAIKDADAAHADVTELRLQLVREVKTVWWNLFYLDRALDVIERNRSLLQQFIGVAETRYQVGKGQQQDVLLAQLEVSKLRDRALRLHKVRDNQSTRLNTLLDRRVDRAVVLPTEVGLTLPKLPDTEKLLQTSLDTRPSLKAQQNRIASSRARLDLVKKATLPDFKVGAVYGFRQGKNPDGSDRADFASLLFSLNLPIYASRKQDKAVDQHAAEWQYEKNTLSDKRGQVASEVNDAITDYRRSSEQVVLFREEIIPQARQTVEAMLAGYQVNKVDFLGLIRAQTTLYDYETQYWSSLSAAKQALARLAAAVGKEKIDD